MAYSRAKLGSGNLEKYPLRRSKNRFHNIRERVSPLLEIALKIISLEEY
jgi:hypothetical protein